MRSKYRRLFSSTPWPTKPGPKGPADALVHAVIELKSRNPRFGCPRIARIIFRTFAISNDLEETRRHLDYDFGFTVGASTGLRAKPSGTMRRPANTRPSDGCGVRPPGSRRRRLPTRLESRTGPRSTFGSGSSRWRDPSSGRQPAGLRFWAHDRRPTRGSAPTPTRGIPGPARKDHPRRAAARRGAGGFHSAGRSVAEPSTRFAKREPRC